MSVLRARPRGRGLLSAALIFLVAGLCVALNLGRLLSELHGEHAQNLSQHGKRKQLDSALVAARDWAPWSSKAYQRQVHLSDARSERALTSAVGALRLDPADPYLWMELSLVLAAQRQYGRALDLGLERTQQLAPTSPVLQYALATMGVREWINGGPQSRHLWVAGMRFMLTYFRRPFLRRMVRTGQKDALCYTMGPQLALDEWCDRPGRRR